MKGGEAARADRLLQDVPEGTLAVSCPAGAPAEAVRGPLRGETPGRGRVERYAVFPAVEAAYHVFRALLLARKQGMKCVGYGAKTKWYFTLNALLREFAGYLKMTWKFHALVVGIAAGTTIAVRLIALFL